MQSRAVTIVLVNVLISLVFIGVAGYNAYIGDVVSAVMLGVLGVCILLLGIGLARAA